MPSGGVLAPALKGKTAGAEHTREVLSPKSTPLTSEADLRFRISTLKTGAWLGLGMIGAGWLYIALSWDAGNRPLLVAVSVGLALGDVGVLLSAGLMARVVAGAWREAFFLSWTLANVASLLFVAALDPVRPSPLTVPLLMPMLFAGMSYPRRMAMACCAAVVLGYTVEVLIQHQHLAFSEFFLMALVWTAGMCLWLAKNREDQHAQLESQRDELARVARADPLTDALNRRGFEERLELELADARRSGRPLAIAVLDLDDFKGVNDREGHSAGDALLCATVTRMRDLLRPMDAVGRMGGDEFAVLYPGAGEADCAAAVANLAAALEDRVAVSIGYSVFPTDGISARQLCDAADRRLYAAKGQRARVPETIVLELSWATALADAVDCRMAGDHRHSRRVADLSVAIAERLRWSPQRLGLLRLAATLHDVGKVAIPDRILNKPGALDAAEYEEIKQHTLVGAEMLSHINGLGMIVPWVRHSHEHFDGSGYPDGLAGRDIPLASRILLTADAFDAMTSHRPYRRAMGAESAAEELLAGAGTQFDPDCVSALLSALTLAGDHDPVHAAA